MQTKTLFIFLFILFSFCAIAQPFAQPQAQPMVMQSQQIMQNGQNYDGTIYAPFTTATPSEQAQQEPNRAPRHPGTIRRGLIDGPNSGQGPSPVGEPWILALFALLMAGGIAVKRRRNKTL